MSNPTWPDWSSARRIPVTTATELDTLLMAREWIDNLARAFGESTVLNYLPNNTGGRVWLNAMIERMQEEELAS